MRPSAERLTASTKEEQGVKAAASGAPRAGGRPETEARSQAGP